MTKPGVYVAEQFDDPAQQRETATLGMWVFLATEVLFFGAMFTGYLVYRVTYPEAFKLASKHMNVTAGTINTAVLILSSLAMALAVGAGESRNRKRVMAFLGLTMVLGAAFLGIKGYEYHHHILDDKLPGQAWAWSEPHGGPAQIFFSFYWVMTAIHSIHLIIGIGVLGVLAGLSRRGFFDERNYNAIEVAGLFWHFIDIVWVFLYPTFYLV